MEKCVLARAPKPAREARALPRRESLSSLSLFLLFPDASGFLVAQHRDEQVGDARPAHLAERGELLAIGLIEQQDAAAERPGARGSA